MFLQTGVFYACRTRYGGCAWRIFGICRGPICPVLHTCARLPPYLRASGRGQLPSHIGAVNHGQTYAQSTPLHRKSPPTH
ncbi:hypothetical protein E4O96_09085 [Pseudomonas fluorescens]|nr:hypothetical protein [Pseudomonas fluorescens]